MEPKTNPLLAFKCSFANLDGVQVTACCLMLLPVPSCSAPDAAVHCRSQTEALLKLILSFLTIPDYTISTSTGADTETECQLGNHIKSFKILSSKSLETILLLQLLTIRFTNVKNRFTEQVLPDVLTKCTLKCEIVAHRQTNRALKALMKWICLTNKLMQMGKVYSAESCLPEDSPSSSFKTTIVTISDQLFYSANR